MNDLVTPPRRNPRAIVLQREPRTDARELKLLDKHIVDHINEDLLVYRTPKRTHYRFWNAGYWEEEKVTIPMVYTKCVNAFEKFREIINCVWGMGDVVEIHVHPRDFGLTDLCGRFDYTWHKLVVRQKICSPLRVTAFPTEKSNFDAPICIPQTRIGVEMRRLYIQTQVTEGDRTKQWLRFCHDDMIDTAMAMTSVADGCVLPTYPIMWIIDWLPDMFEQNVFVKISWLEKLQQSVRKIIEKRKEKERKINT